MPAPSPRLTDKNANSSLVVSSVLTGACEEPLHLHWAVFDLSRIAVEVLNPALVILDAIACERVQILTRECIFQIV